MKRSSYFFLINLMSWIFRIVFFLHLSYVLVRLFPTHLKYGYGGWINKSEQGWELTTHGYNYLAPAGTEKSHIEKRAVPGKRTVILTYGAAIQAFYYSDPALAFHDKALLVILLELLYNLGWLSLTFALMKIFTSLAKHHVFEIRTVRYLRLIALVAGLLPLIKVLRDYLFTKVMILNTPSEEYRIIPYRIARHFPELAMGALILVLIFILAEIFKQGFLLKQEHDLTV